MEKYIMFNFEVTRRSYSVEINQDDFLNLLDSESHVTNDAAFQSGNSTLSEKLEKISGVSAVDYSGHYGSAIYFDIDADDDTDELKSIISETITNHLLWCKELKSN